MIHIVGEGETIYGIAGTYGVEPEALIFDNELPPDGALVVGQALLVLIPDATYTVGEGDTIYSIAAANGLSSLALVRNNLFLLGAGVLKSGDTLVLSYEEESKVPLVANGYAYPFTQRRLLEEALLYLSELSVFSYGFTIEGELLPPASSDLLAQAARFGVSATLVLTSINEQGVFSNQLVNTLVEDISLQEKVIQNLLSVCVAEGYEAVDVDFEYILASDRENYVAFITRLAKSLHTEDIEVYVALPPKVSADQPGLLYEGIDYRGIGEAADGVLLMTYEWGYKYGPPMAVAPIPSVRRVLDYAITEIPVEKISMGIPNYAYDWPLPYERGVTAATTIGNTQAVAVARENGAEILYDTNAQAPYFEYVKGGIEHVVWFEDVRSIQAKFDLIKEYRFRGAGYWNLLRSFRSNWLLLNQNFHL